MEDCSYEAMIQVLYDEHKSYLKTGKKSTYRKILPPDNKPVELSTCSKNSQDLFIQPS